MVAPPSPVQRGRCSSITPVPHGLPSAAASGHTWVGAPGQILQVRQRLPHQIHAGFPAGPTRSSPGAGRNLPHSRSPAGCWVTGTC